MTHRILCAVSIVAVTAQTSIAGTFDRTAISPDLGVDTFSRNVARAQVDRDLFSTPYATALIGNVDVYDVFPYVEARYFQVVSDPSWNRLLFGEQGKGLTAYAGDEALGALKEPHGLAVDDAGRLFVADTGNDRVVVFRVATEFDTMTLSPVEVIDGLSRPYDVAVSDGGTPFESSDDRLYVADTGMNRVVAFAVGDGSARRLSELGGLGSGVGRFAGPMAVAVGHEDGRATDVVYVADAHNRRIVSLRDVGGQLSWAGEQRHTADVVTALDSDHWGNLYAAAPNEGTVQKYNANLFSVARLTGGVTRPRDVHVPFVTVRDHRTGSTTRSGQSTAFTVEEWTNDTGMQRWALGVEASGLTVEEDHGLTVGFRLTDHADVLLEVEDLSGRDVATRRVTALAAGDHRVDVRAEDFVGIAAPGEYRLRLTASSSYEGGSGATVETTFRMQTATAGVVPTVPVLVGNYPNPFRSPTQIEFLLPADGADRAELRVFDLRGRLVHTMQRANLASGANSFTWDGTDTAGHDVAAGVYFYRLTVGERELVDKMVLIR